MPLLIRNRSFSLYLLLFIIILISLITAGITIGDLIIINAGFQDNAALLRNETEGNLNISVKAIDNGLKLFDNTLNRRMEAAFVLFTAEYNIAGGDPSKMDLEQIKRDLGGEMDLYIINDSGVVEYTTYLPDKGLDFSVAIPYFYEYLMEIKDSDGFYPDRVVQEQATGQLKKFAYMPTPDHKYILELGLTGEAFRSERNSLRYTDMIQKVREQNPYIRDLRIFTTAKRLVGNRSYVPDPELSSLLDDILTKRSSPEFRDPSLGITKKYQYIDLRDENYASDMSLIVEIVYDDILIAQSQRQIVLFHLFIAIGSLLLGIVGAIAISRHVTRPLAKISDDVNIISGGNLDHKISPALGVEFEVLTESIDSMVKTLKGMIAQLQGSERQLRESEERYRGVIETQAELIVRFLPDGTHVFVNEAYCNYFGVSCSEMLGKKMWPRIPDEDKIPLKRHFSSLTPEHPTATIEHRIITHDNEIRWVQWNDQAIFGENGEVTEYQSVGRDITERRQVEQNLIESERKFRDLASLLPQVIFEIDLTGRITYVNKSAYDIFGYSPEELRKGLYFIHFILPPDRERAQLNFMNSLEGQKINSAEYHMVKKDGSLLTAMVYSSPITRDDTVTGLRGILVDITQLKQVEDNIRKLNEELEERVRSRTADLEAANRELDSFSYSVSHDLRAPLRAIDGFTTILTREHASSLPADTLLYLQKIRENTRKMGMLIDDLLNFSRMSRQPLNRFLIDPASVAEEAYDELRTETAGRTVHLEIRDMQACSADPVLLHQVYSNLISNALKFTRRKEIAEIEIGSSESDGRTVYYVKDNGSGFDMKYAPKVFGVFQRVHDDPSLEGTGVGLAIVERIIHRHRGEIWVESEPGKGTTFFFTLG